MFLFKGGRFRLSRRHVPTRTARKSTPHGRRPRAAAAPTPTPRERQGEEAGQAVALQKMPLIPAEVAELAEVGTLAASGSWRAPRVHDVLMQTGTGAGSIGPIAVSHIRGARRLYPTIAASFVPSVAS